MSIFNRLIAAAVRSSFTSGFLQLPLDSAAAGIRNERRRIDELRYARSDRWIILSKIVGQGLQGDSPSDYTWGMPQLMIQADGVVANKISLTNSNPLITEMRMLRDIPVSMPFDPDWSEHSDLPHAFNRSVCVIPGLYNGSGAYSGVLCITVKQIYGDRVSGDILITVKADSETVAYCEADTGSSEKLPDGTLFYHNWILHVPTSGQINVDEVRDALASDAFLNYFDVYAGRSAEYSNAYIGTVERSYGFLRLPVSLYFSQTCVTALYTALTRVFDETFTPELSTERRQTRAVVIRIPQLSNNDGLITDISRYMTSEGELAVDPAWILEERHVVTSSGNIAAGDTALIPFAVRVDEDTVIMCDGTRIYRRDITPSPSFKPATGSRRFILTGNGMSYLNLSTLSYIHSDGRSRGSISPWSESRNGSYSATTLVQTEGANINTLNIWEADSREFTFFKYQSVDEPGLSMRLPLLSLDRTAGIMHVGGNKYTASDSVKRGAPRDLKGLSTTSYLKNPWTDTMINLSAPSRELESDGSRCGMLFSRAFADYADDDTRSCSYLFVKYGLAATGSVSGAYSGGMYLFTNTNKLALGCSTEEFDGSTLPIESRNWKTVFQMRGGDNRRDDAGKDNASMFRVCRGGQYYGTGSGYSESLPGIREYFSTSKKDRSGYEWEGFCMLRLFAADNSIGSAYSADPNDPRRNLGLAMWTRKGIEEDSYIKLMRKIGDNAAAGGSLPGIDLPGEVGLRIGKRTFAAGVTAPCVELTALSQFNSGSIYGCTKYIPKIMAAVYDIAPGTLNSSIVFCGLTTGTSTEECVFTGQGLTVYDNSMDGFSRLLHTKKVSLTTTDFTTEMYVNATGINMVDHGGLGSFRFNTVGRTFIKCGQADAGLLIGGLAIAEGGISIFQETVSPKTVGLTVLSEGIHLYAKHEDATVPITPADTTIKATIAVETLVPPYYSVYTGVLKKRHIVSTEYPAGEEVLIFVVE